VLCVAGTVAGAGRHLGRPPARHEPV